MLLQYKASHSRRIKSASETGNVGFASLNYNNNEFLVYLLSANINLIIKYLHP